MHLRQIGIAAAAVAILGPVVAIGPAPDLNHLDGACVALQVGGKFVVRDSLGGYQATGNTASEPFRFQRSGRDSYLFYSTADDFVRTGTPRGPLLSARAAGPESNWKLSRRHHGHEVTVTSVLTGEKLAVELLTGALITVSNSTPGAHFTLVPGCNCAVAPEASLNVDGTPFTGTVDGEVRGLADLHGHLTAYEFIGGDIHCGAPFSPYGVTKALVDCPDHEPNGTGAWFENLSSGAYPSGTHNTTGWPTFRDWPKHDSWTHEAMYYKWLERAWRGGLRLYTNFFVNNEALCELYPLKRNPCDDMSSIRLQAQRIYELQDYIDGQAGGRGEGWFRIVKNPEEARAVIEEGKLAVTLGVEVSQVFGCGIKNGVPQCNETTIDKGLDELFSLGVRRMFVCHKIDNALCGVRFDSGEAGETVNMANFYSTGEFWQVEECTTAAEDNPISSIKSGPLVDLILAISPLPPNVTLPVYADNLRCNAKGLTSLGEYTVRQMMSKGMIVDIDHMGVKAAAQTLHIIESEEYAGVISGHSWMDPTYYPRVYSAGGMVVPYGFGTEAFHAAWQIIKPQADPRFTFGFGAGFDTGGFGPQPPPRPLSSVQYPFTTFDGGSQVDKQQSGERVFDVNIDGFAHYGMLPDWLEDLRLVSGEEGEDIVNDMGRGAEAYLQVWSRVADKCSPERREPKS
ncbi:hypothetical protein GQ53DRAFT_876304 [Thozetella sp. PMI_491]|nr:hypothetical protein GQ53DRAFT_876304 [Thozetella sp. PMI_491]